MEASQPAISVVIASRDRPRLLTEVVSRLCGQLQDRDELIVVDDSASGSFDSASLRGCRVRRSHGIGPAAARNVGWRSSNGEIVAFTDDDVVHDKFWLESVRKYFTGMPELVAIEGRTDTRPYDPLYEYSVSSKEARNGLTCNVAYRKSVLDALNGFDEGFKHPHCEDVDLFRRAQECGPVGYGEEMRVWHAPRAFGLRAFARRARWVSGELRLYRRHPQIKPLAAPPAICVLIVYLLAPLRTVGAGPSTLRNPRRLLRTLVLCALWWANLAAALPRFFLRARTDTEPRDSAGDPSRLSSP
jgi:glycosyltransferase involved in cell wall biosynthesis